MLEEFNPELKQINDEMKNAFIGIVNRHGFLTAEQFAKRFKLSLGHVQRICREHKVGALRFGRFWLLVDSQIYPKYRRIGKTKEGVKK